LTVCYPRSMVAIKGLYQKRGLVVFFPNARRYP
jgi:hypothetical protein